MNHKFIDVYCVRLYFLQHSVAAIQEINEYEDA